MIEVEPFSRVIWRWGVPPKYKIALEASHRAMSWAEYESVVRGYRPCDVVHLYPETWDRELKRFAEDGLYFVPIQRAKPVSGFAHRFYEPTGGRFMVYGVVSPSLSDAMRFVRAHEGRPCDHETIGILLGYPECCIRFFVENFPKGILDPVWRVEHEGEDPMLNVMLRYFGPRIIPFFPCSYTCRQARRVAEKFYGLLREYDEDLAETILEMLSMPMVWSMYKSVIQVTTPLFTGICNGYWEPQRINVYWRGDPERWAKKFPLQYKWFLSEIRFQFGDNIPLLNPP